MEKSRFAKCSDFGTVGDNAEAHGNSRYAALDGLGGISKNASEDYVAAMNGNFEKEWNKVYNSVIKDKNGKSADKDTIANRMGYSDQKEREQYEKEHPELYEALKGVKYIPVSRYSNSNKADLHDRLQSVAVKELENRFENFDTEELSAFMNDLQQGKWKNADTMEKYGKMINDYFKDCKALDEIGYFNSMSQENKKNYFEEISKFKHSIDSYKKAFSEYKNETDYRGATVGGKYDTLNYQELWDAKVNISKKLNGKQTNDDGVTNQDLQYVEKLLSGNDKIFLNYRADIKKASVQELNDIIRKVHYGIVKIDKARSYIASANELAAEGASEHGVNPDEVIEDADAYIEYVLDYYKQNGTVKGARECYNRRYNDMTGKFEATEEKNSPVLDYADTIIYYLVEYGSYENMKKIRDEALETQHNQYSSEEFQKYYNEMVTDLNSDKYISDGKKIYKKKNKNISDDEYNVACYYLGKGKKDDYYFMWLEDLVNERESVAEHGWSVLTDAQELKYHSTWSKYTRDAPLEANMLSVALNLFSGVELLHNTLNGEVKELKTAKASSEIRNAYSNTHDIMIGNYDIGDFMYNNLMSAIDSLIPSVMLGESGSAVLAMSAAASGINDALNRGMSKEKAFWNGLASGAFEYIFENYSIDNFEELKRFEGTGFKAFLGNLAKSMITNAAEEGYTEIANIMYDSIVNGDYSNYKSGMDDYINMGYSKSEAKTKIAQDFVKQVVEAAMGGALMGFAFDIVGTALSTRNAANIGKYYYGYSQSQVLAMIDNGLAMPEQSKAYLLAKKADADFKSGKKVSGSMLYNIAVEIKNEIATESHRILIELGESKRNAAELSPIIAKAVFGDKLSSIEYEKIKNSKSGIQVFEMLVEKEEYTVWRRSSKKTTQQYMQLTLTEDRDAGEMVSQQESIKFAIDGEEYSPNRQKLIDFAIRNLDMAVQYKKDMNLNSIWNSLKNTLLVNENLISSKMYIEVLKHKLIIALESQEMYEKFKNYMFNKNVSFGVWARIQCKNSGIELTDNATATDAIEALVKHRYYSVKNDQGIDSAYRAAFTLDDALREVFADFFGEALFDGKAYRINTLRSLADGKLFKEISKNELLSLNPNSMSALKEIAEHNLPLFKKIFEWIKMQISKLKASKVESDNLLANELEHNNMLLEDYFKDKYNSLQNRLDSEQQSNDNNSEQQENGFGNKTDNNSRPTGENTANRSGSQNVAFKFKTDTQAQDDTSATQDNSQLSIGTRKNRSEKLNTNEISAVEDICNRLGIKVKFENLGDTSSQNGNTVSPDGYLKNNIIHINLYAANPIGFVFKHELAHFCEKASGYTRFKQQVKKSGLYKKWLFKKTKEKNIKIAEYKYKKIVFGKYNKVRNINDSKLEAELIADFSGDMLFTENGSKMASIITDTRVKYRKGIVGFVANFISYIKKKINGHNFITLQLSVLEDSFNRMLSEAVEIKNSGIYKFDDDVSYCFAVCNDEIKIKEAERLEGKGLNYKEIFIETGLLRDAFGKWLFEMDTSHFAIYHDANAGTTSHYLNYKLKWERGAFNCKLGDIVSYKKLYQNYPKLRELHVTIQDSNGPDDTIRYVPSRDTLFINKKLWDNYESNKREFRAIMMGALQRTIQYFDGRTSNIDIKTLNEMEANGKLPYSELHNRRLNAEETQKYMFDNYEVEMVKRRQRARDVLIVPYTLTKIKSMERYLPVMDYDNMVVPSNEVGLVTLKDDVYQKLKRYIKEISESYRNGMEVNSAEINAIDEVLGFDKGENQKLKYENTPERNEIRRGIARKLLKYGRAVFDENSKAKYSGFILKERRADIVLGLPSASSSTSLVAALSENNFSRIIDEDMVKEWISEYDNSVYSKAVLEESRLITDEILKTAVENGENIVNKIIADNYKAIFQKIQFLKSKDYTVYIHFDETPVSSILSDTLKRYLYTGAVTPMGEIVNCNKKMPKIFDKLIKEEMLADGYTRSQNYMLHEELPGLVGQSGEPLSEPAENQEAQAENFDKYTKKEYHNFGWVKYNEVLTESDYDLFTSLYASNGKNKFAKTKEKEAIVYSEQSPQILVYMKGTVSQPTITRVININTNIPWDIKSIREEIIENESSKGDSVFESIENKFGKGILTYYNATDLNSYDRYEKEISGETEEENDNNNDNGYEDSEQDEWQLIDEDFEKDVFEANDTVCYYNDEELKQQEQEALRKYRCRNRIKRFLSDFYFSRVDSIHKHNISVGSDGIISDVAKNSKQATEYFNEDKLKKLSETPISDHDTFERKLSDEVKENFKNTIFKNEQGELTSFYVLGMYGLGGFKRARLGLVAGTLESAIFEYEKFCENNKKRKRKPVIKEIFINMKNALVLPYTPSSVTVDNLHYLVEKKIISQSEYDRLLQKNTSDKSYYDSYLYKKLRNHIKKSGYDGILYFNNTTDIGSMSVVLFDEEQMITVSKNGELQKNCGVTREKFDLNSAEDKIVDPHNSKRLKYYINDHKFNRRKSRAQADPGIKLGNSGFMDYSVKDRETTKKHINAAVLNNRNIELSGKDTLGRQIKQFEKTDFSHTVFKNENGDLISLFLHTSSTLNIEKALKSGACFLNFDSAFKKWIEKKKSTPLAKYGVMNEYHINIENPWIAETDKWDSRVIADEMLKRHIISEKYYQLLFSNPVAVKKMSIDGSIAEKLIDYMKLKGFDGVIFVDDNGQASVMPFEKKQLVLISENGIAVDSHYANQTNTDNNIFDDNYKIDSVVIDRGRKIKVDTEKIECELEKCDNNTEKLKALTESLMCKGQPPAESSGEISVGNSGVFEKSDFTINRMGDVLYELSERAEYTPTAETDTAGRKIPEGIRKALDKSILKDKYGRPYSMFCYNSSGKTYFRNKGANIRVSTLRAAHDIAYEQIKQSHKFTKGVYEEYYAVVNNPYQITADCVDVTVEILAECMYDEGILTEQQYYNVMSRFNKGESKTKIRRNLAHFLKNRGFDSIVFNNKAIDAGSKSVIVFNEKQLIPVSKNGALAEEFFQ